jgi:dual specificity protein kinase YAK1
MSKVVISEVELTSSNPPSHLLEVGKQTHEFFNCHVDSHGRKNYTLKPMDQYAAEHRTNEQPSKQYFKQTRLNDIIMEYSFSKKNAKQSDIDKGKSRSDCKADDQKWLIDEHL